MSTTNSQQLLAQHSAPVSARNIVVQQQRDQVLSSNLHEYSDCSVLDNMEAISLSVGLLNDVNLNVGNMNPQESFYTSTAPSTNDLTAFYGTDVLATLQNDSNDRNLVSSTQDRIADSRRNQGMEAFLNGSPFGQSTGNTDICTESMPSFLGANGGVFGDDLGTTLLNESDSLVKSCNIWSDIDAITTKDEPFILEENYEFPLSKTEMNIGCFGELAQDAYLDNIIFEDFLRSTADDSGILDDGVNGVSSVGGNPNQNEQQPNALYSEAKTFDHSNVEMNDSRSTMRISAANSSGLLQQQQQEQQQQQQQQQQLSSSKTLQNNNMNNLSGHTTLASVRRPSNAILINNQTPQQQSNQQSQQFSSAINQMDSNGYRTVNYATSSSDQQQQGYRIPSSFMRKDYSAALASDNSGTFLSHSVPRCQDMLMTSIQNRTSAQLTDSPTFRRILGNSFGNSNEAKFNAGGFNASGVDVASSPRQTPGICLPLLTNSDNPNTNVGRLSSSAPTHLGFEHIWMRREPRQHLLSTSSLVEAESYSSLSTGSILSPDCNDYSQDDEDYCNSTEDNSDPYDDELSSDNNSDNEECLQSREMFDSSNMNNDGQRMLPLSISQSSLAANNNNKIINSERNNSTNMNYNNGKGKERYFWQYNVQAKGPKGKRLVFQSKLDDPHVLNEVTDPVFSPNCSVKGIKVYKHNGKARKGDGNDLTPNPRKLHNIGNELDRLSRTINDMIPVAELPINARPKSRKEKNKLASRACRLKKKAQHEANKIKLYGLEIEHKRLLSVIGDLKPTLILKYQQKNMGNSTEEVNQKINNLFIKASNGLSIAGITTEFVNKILENIKNGQQTGGLDELANNA